jgi:hypothetical protein
MRWRTAIRHPRRAGFRSLHFPPERFAVVEIHGELVCVVTMRPLLVMFSTCLWACGDNWRLPPDAPPDAPPFEPAPHVPMPRVFAHAGVVLSAVQLVTITFEGYALRADVEAFGDMIVGSAWLRNAGVAYHVSAGVHAKKHRLGAAAPSLTRDAIRHQIADLIAAGDVPRPAAEDNQLVYLVYIPPSVVFADTPGAGDETSPWSPAASRFEHGYHEMATLDSGERFPIAVVVDDGTGLAATTVAAGHQLIEAVTNPYEPPLDGYYADPPKTDPWSLVHGEIADLCEGEAAVVEDDFALPRIYSNQAAFMGGSPCVPFGSDDTWSDVTARPSQLQMVRRGESVTFELTGWSTREVPDWELRTRVAERSDLSEEQMRPQLSSDTINNKTTATLRLSAPPDATPGSVGGIYILSGTHARPWAVGFAVE